MQPTLCLFAWEARWGNILTLDQWQRRLDLANKCFLCQESEEMADHLLLHCANTRVMCKLLFSLFEVSWAIASSIWEIF